MYREDETSRSPILVDRPVRGIVATTDFHSNLRNAPRMVQKLTDACHEAVIVDCGDFFEGTWFYTTGKGEIETEILLASYDLVVPGNHGWARYLDSEITERTVCVNVVDEEGQRMFAPFARVQIAGRRIGVVGVIGREAFEAIPRSERGSASWIEPALAIRALQAENPDVERWCIVSHSGVDNDVELSRRVDVDLIFSGHCHSVLSDPLRQGQTWIAKGRELGVGYAAADLVDGRWRVSQSDFRETPIPDGSLLTRIDSLEERGAEVVATARPHYRNVNTHSPSLVHAIAERVSRSFDAVVLLNGTALRETYIGELVFASTLADVEPFGNTLVEATSPGDLASVVARLDTNGMHPACVQVGPWSLRFITTSYLAEAYFPAMPHRRCGALADHVLAEIGE